MASNLNSERQRLANDLRTLLLPSLDSEASQLHGLTRRIEAEHAPLMDSDDRLHEIYHYLADSDVRADDDRYRESQRRAIRDIIDYLERAVPGSSA